MNELWHNMTTLDWSDYVRFIGIFLSFWAACELAITYPVIRDDATERLRQLYYGQCAAVLTFGSGLWEGYMRNRPGSYTLFLILLSLSLILTGLKTGVPSELFRRGFDRGFGSGSEDHPRDRDA